MKTYKYYLNIYNEQKIWTQTRYFYTLSGLYEYIKTLPKTYLFYISEILEDEQND